MMLARAAALQELKVKAPAKSFAEGRTGAPYSGRRILPRGDYAEKRGKSGMLAGPWSFEYIV
jgi:hypothetical protein